MTKIILLLGLFSLTQSQSCQNNTDQSVASTSQEIVTSIQPEPGQEVITLGGGCFWCVEAVYEELEGVSGVVSGYSGGTVKNPSYKEISSGNTGHAEVAQVYFDPKVVKLETILDVFWSTHDPTTLNRQGYDIGTQYRSIILYHDDTQREIALKSLEEVANPLWDNEIVTEVVAFESFYPAEKEHQDFYALNPNYGYCRAVINPKLEKFRAKFADKLKQQ